MDEVGGQQATVRPRALHAELLKKLTSSGLKKWEIRFTAVIKEECRGFVVLVCKQCKMNLSPANPSMTLVRHTCPSAALAAAKKRQASNADPSEQLQQEEEEEGKWIALDTPADEAQAEHPRICSDSSPAHAVPQIFRNAHHQGRAPLRGCRLPLPEVSTH